MTRQCETLLARVAELEAKLGLPPKTPDNSSTPPSKGQKPSAPASAKSEGKRKLQNMIKRTRRHLFVFVTNRELPATNNGSERALRPCAVFRKITNGFRTEWGAKLYADIRSVIETGRRRAIGALDAIRLTLAGMPLAVP